MLVRLSRPERGGGRTPVAFAAAALAVAAALPSVASAQTGGIGLGQDVHALASVAVATDTNVAQSSAILARLRGLVLEDNTVSPSVELDLTHPIGPQALFLTGVVAYDFYQRNTVLNRERIDLTGGGRFRVSRCDATATLVYGRHLSTLQQLAVTSVQNDTAIDESYKIQADCSRGLGLSPSFSYSETRVDNTLAIQKASDSRLSAATGGIKYQRPNLGSLEVFGEYDKTTYPVGAVAGAPVSSGYTAVAGGVRYTRQVGSRLQADVQVSQRTLKSSIPGGVGYTGLTYKADLSYLVNKRLTVIGSFQNTTSPANLLGVSFQRTQGYNGSLRYQLTSRLLVSAGGSRQEQIYEGQGFNPLFISNTRNTSAFGSAQWDFGRRFRLLLDFRWQESDTNITVLNYSDLRVGLTASAKF